MDQFTSYFLFPILSAITILFIYVAYKAATMQKSQKEHIEQTKQGFSYTNIAIDSVQTDVKEIHGKLEKALIPKLELVYEQLSRSGIRTLPNTILKHLIDSGISNAQFITQDESVIFFGTTTKDGTRKESFLIALKNNDRIDITGFSTWVVNPTEIFLSELLKINSSLDVGKYSIRKMSDKHLICVDHSILCPNGYIDPDELLTVLTRISSKQNILWRLIDLCKMTSNEMLIEEFISLISEGKVENTLLNQSATTEEK
jgi:hypothetical protein